MHKDGIRRNTARLVLKSMVNRAAFSVCIQDRRCFNSAFVFQSIYEASVLLSQENNLKGAIQAKIIQEPLLCGSNVLHSV